MRILIIGAGVAGCIVARQLARLDGIEVTCIERVSADHHAEAGTGLNIGPNAVRSLQALDPALANAITATSYPWEDWTVSTTAGTPLLKLSVPDLGRTQVNGDVNQDGSTNVIDAQLIARHSVGLTTPGASIGQVVGAVC